MKENSGQYMSAFANLPCKTHWLCISDNSPLMSPGVMLYFAFGLMPQRVTQNRHPVEVMRYSCSILTYHTSCFKEKAVE